MKNRVGSGVQPTISDVARAAGVSKATASRVLGGYGYAGAEVRQQVLNAAKRLAYQPNQLARSMATGRSNTIGVIVADIENLYFARAFRAISNTAEANGFGVLLINTDEDIDLERGAVRVMLANRVDGLIVSPTSSVEVNHLISARDMGCPFVLLDRRVPALNADTFAIDNFHAAHNAVLTFIKKKHRRIALVSNAPSHGEQQSLISSVRERIDGYRAALHEAGMPIDQELIVRGGWDSDKLTEKLRRLCNDANRPTAFLATDSSVALILLNVLREAGLIIPDQASLICFDDAEWTSALTPPLSVISQPIRELAAAATLDLIGRLQGDGKTTVQETLLQATLIDRKSVGVARQSRAATIQKAILTD